MQGMTSMPGMLGMTGMTGMHGMHGMPGMPAMLPGMPLGMALPPGSGPAAVALKDAVGIGGCEAKGGTGTMGGKDGGMDAMLSEFMKSCKTEKDFKRMEKMMHDMADQMEKMAKAISGKNAGGAGAGAAQAMDPSAMMGMMGMMGLGMDPSMMAAMGGATPGKAAKNNGSGGQTTAKGEGDMMMQQMMMGMMGGGMQGGSQVDDKAKSQMQMYAAAADAQQTQYMQQYQFYQQMRAQEQQKKAKTETVEPSRFKENFRPMRLCKHLITLGFCRPGRDCTFAHNYDELHPASPDLPTDWKNESDSHGGTGALAEQGEVEESKVPDMRLKKKKEMCGRYSRGECSLGKICPFAHTESELGTVGLAVCGKVKTRLCVFWDASSQTAKGCIYGRNCNNAHGEWEIGTKRPPPELCPPMKRRRDGESVIAGRD